MKRIIIILLAAVLLAAPVAAKDDATPLVVQLLHDETDALPQNTIELHLRSLEFSKKAHPGLAQALQTLARQLSDADSYNYVYELHFTPRDGGVDISINSLDHLSTADTRRRDYYGVWLLDRARFVVTETRENSKFLKSLFVKSKKHAITQEYEIVDVKRDNIPSNALAHWDGNAMNITTIYADGTEQTLATDGN